MDSEAQPIARKRPLVVGVVGGIAAGKSFVAGELARLGGAVICADKLGHESLTEEPVKAALVQRWGDGILDASGQIDRSAVARRVFSPPPHGPPQLTFLESVVHPRIATKMRERLNGLASEVPPPLIVIDAALLFEGGWDAFCDHVIFVDAPDEVRKRRAIERGWSLEDVAAREATQWNPNEKRRRADSVIDAGGTREETRSEVEAWWRRHVATD